MRTPHAKPCPQLLALTTLNVPDGGFMSGGKTTGDCAGSFANRVNRDGRFRSALPATGDRGGPDANSVTPDGRLDIRAVDGGGRGSGGLGGDWGEPGACGWRGGLIGVHAGRDEG